MYEIDKEAFGTFLSQLRKEKGMTQKDLAERLFVSDKAVSKWERGLSLPDVTLLQPLADLMEVTISELLSGQRIQAETPLTAQEAERLVSGALHLTAQEQENRRESRRRWGLQYALGVLVLAVELLFPAEDKKPWLKTLDAIAIGALALVTLALNDVTYSERGPKLEVRLVQPDLPVTMAYRPAEAAARIDRAVAMSNRSAMGKPLDLIVWPESTIVTPLRDGLDSAALAAVDVAEKTGAAVVFNAFFREGPGRYYNAMWMAESNHRPARLIYRKHHLVPFGEFVPTGFRWFVDALGIPMADQLRGPVGGDSFDVAGIQAAGGICYENMFGEELRHAWDKANPGFILNTANLGWFTDAVLPQFTAMSAMRARETARPLIQAVQNAHSALIGPDGKTQRLASKGAQNLDMTVVTATGSPTPFVRYGHWPLIGLLVVLLASCLTLAFRVVRRQQA